jgi:CheY-like chemotaxis protein
MPHSPGDRFVLVVEDDPDTRSALRDLLALAGYRSLTAANGVDALRMLERDADVPCVILLDLMMPVLDGWEFLERQKKNARLASVPVVILTADPRAGEDRRRQEALALLMKPVDPDALIEVVSRYC